MIVNLKSARELKPKNNINKETIILENGKRLYNNSRNKNLIKFQSLTKQIIKNKSKEKDKQLNKHSLLNNKVILILKKKMILNLKKYNVTEDKYNKRIINDIIYDEKKHIVSEFKNYLLWAENSEFLKRFYYLHESINRLPKINYYYEKYTLFSPVYFSLEDIVKIMIKNVTKKKKYLEMIEEMEDNVNEKKEIKKLDFNNIINPKDVTNSEYSNYKNFEYNSFSFSKFDDNNLNNKDFSQIINFIVNDNESLLDNLKNKNNDSKGIKNSILDLENSLFSDIINLEKKNFVNENFIKIIEDSNKTKIPKIGKILEVKKLNFQNLNNNENNIITKKQKNKLNKNKIKSGKITYSNRDKNILKENKNSKINKKQNKKVLINQKLNNQIPNSERLSSSKKQKKKKEKPILNKSIEKMIKFIGHSSQTSRREKNNFKKISKDKKKKNVVEINLNSKNESNKKIMHKNKNYINQKKRNEKIDGKENINSNKKILVNKLLMTSPNFTPTETTPSSFITNNNNVTSSVHNINLNLNIGHSSYNSNNIINNKNINNKENNNNNSNINNNNNLIDKSITTKINYNISINNNNLKGNQVLNSGNNQNNIKQKHYNIRNVINNNNNGNTIPISSPLSQYSSLFKSKNIKTEKFYNDKINQKEKKSYDLKRNNFHISIQKNSLRNNTINHEIKNHTNSSSNIIINNYCIYNNNEKNYSKNFDYSLYSQKNKKKLVFPINEIKYSNSSRRLCSKKKKEKNSNNCKIINKDKKKKIYDKQYPLTSRNEKNNDHEFYSVKC